jgi:nucleoside-diphosphate-sugar epimerase
VKIFVTGSSGYVGQVMVKRILEKNFDVVGCDVEYFPNNFKGEIGNFTKIKKDIRDLEEKDLVGFDAVFHLAGLSNDPLGEINPNLTNTINYLATVRLAKLAKKNKIKNFVFSSSCSAYGVNDDIVNEESPLAPITEYAKSKVNSEKDILMLKNEDFFPTVLRNATVYGISPNLRLDLVVNNLTASAVTMKKVRLLSDGTAWRPLLHVEDMADAFLTVVESSPEKISGQIFNVGKNEDNFTVKQIAEHVKYIVKDSKLEYADNSNKDNRSYRVDFSKIKNQLNFKTKWTLSEGIKNIYEEIVRFGLTKESFESDKFFRVRSLKKLIQEKKINLDLRYI